MVRYVLYNMGIGLSQYGRKMPNNHFGRHKKSTKKTPMQMGRTLQNTKTTGKVQELFAAIGLLKTLAMQYTVAELTNYKHKLLIGSSYQQIYL